MKCREISLFHLHFDCQMWSWRSQRIGNDTQSLTWAINLVSIFTMMLALVRSSNKTEMRLHFDFLHRFESELRPVQSEKSVEQWYISLTDRCKCKWLIRNKRSIFYKYIADISRHSFELIQKPILRTRRRQEKKEDLKTNIKSACAKMIYSSK